MEQKNGYGKQKSVVTFCVSYSKIIIAIISTITLIGFGWGFVKWATLMSDRNEKIPTIETRVNQVDKKVGEICTAVDFIGKAQAEQTKRIDKILFEIKKK